MNKYTFGAAAQKKSLEVDLFKGVAFSDSIEKISAEGLTGFYMPELALLRISNPTSTELWTNYIESYTLIAYGKKKNGTDAYAIANLSNFLTQNPGLIRRADEPFGDDSRLINNLLPIPDQYFYDLERRDGETDKNGITRIKLVSVDDVFKAGTTDLSKERFLNHPLAQGIFGSKEILEAYAEIYFKNYGSKINLFCATRIPGDFGPGSFKSHYFMRAGFLSLSQDKGSSTIRFGSLLGGKSSYFVVTNNALLDNAISDVGYKIDLAKLKSMPAPVKEKKEAPYVFQVKPQAPILQPPASSLLQDKKKGFFRRLFNI